MRANAARSRSQSADVMRLCRAVCLEAVCNDESVARTYSYTLNRKTVSGDGCGADARQEGVFGDLLSEAMFPLGTEEP